MRKILSVFFLTIGVLSACSTGEKYLITGEWKEGDGDGQTVFLSKKIDADHYENVDSTVVANGLFEFKGQSPVDLRTLIIGTQKTDIILDGNPIQVVVSSKTKEAKGGGQKTFYDVTINGSEEYKVLNEGNKLNLGKGFMKFGLMYMIVQAKDDSLKVDSLYKQMVKIEAERDDSIRSFLESHNDNYATTFLVSDFVVRDYPLEDVKHYYDLLTPRIKNSNPGKLLQAKIEALSHINVGGTAYDIELPAPDGTIVKLSSLRGKYVLIDFWASWCKPCLAEAPNVKEIYDKYHDKGFEVYGVSLDEKKDLWENAIEKHQLNWVHVSSLQGWKCPVAVQYNVTGIPKTFLLDPQGVIVAVDLRGDELKEKVSSLLD
jgi:peroxiredoxin